MIFFSIKLQSQQPDQCVIESVDSDSQTNQLVCFFLNAFHFKDAPRKASAEISVHNDLFRNEKLSISKIIV